MFIVTILSAIFTAVFVIAVVIGAIVGAVRGAYRSGVKLGANILSALISLGITLLMRNILGKQLSILTNLLPEAYKTIGELGVEVASLVSQTVDAFVLLFVFTSVFFIVRLIMLIPQYLICRKLPKGFDDAVNAAKADETGEGYEEDRKSGIFILWRTLWHGGAILCGALSAIIVVGAFLMPLSGIIVRGGTVVSDVANVLATEPIPEEDTKGFRLVVEAADTFSSNPLFSVTDFFYGQTVFEPILTIKTDDGKINLADEIVFAGDIACDIIPPIIHIAEDQRLMEGDGERLKAGAEKLAENNFLLTFGSFMINAGAESLDRSGDLIHEQKGEAEKAFNEDLMAVMKDMTPDTLAKDILTIADLGETLAESELVYLIVGGDGELSLDRIAEEETLDETLGEAFGIIYDNEHAKSLLVSTINMGSNTVFEAIGAEPVYSDTDIDNVSREELVAEAGKLGETIRRISDFVESTSEDGSDITTYDLGAAGKAIDTLKSGVLFGNKVPELVDSISGIADNSGETGANTVLETVKDAVIDSDSAENVLNSTQSVAVISKELESGETKGKENENLVSALETLNSNDSQKDREAITSLTEEILGVSSITSGASAQNVELVNDTVKAMNEVIGSEDFNAEAEADAIQTLYDATHAESGNVFDDVRSEKEAVDILLASDIAMNLIENLIEESKNYGIPDKLTEDNKTNIKNAVAENGADDARKQLLLTFLNISR